MSTVRIAPGTGYVMTQGRSLLYVPQWHDGLAVAFEAGDDADVARRIASVAIDTGFDLTPFVCVSWVDRLHVMVFGEVEVETTMPALPMLSGAASRTWVERTVELTADLTADVWSGGEVDEHAVLRAGTALAGGFRLELRPPDDEPARASASSEPERRTSSFADDVTSATGIEVDADTMEAETTGTGRATATHTFEAGDSDTVADGWPAEPRDTETRDTVMRDSETRDTETQEAASAGAPLAFPPPRPDDAVAVTAADAATIAGDGGGGPPLVAAKRCALDHPNPPSNATCDFCGGPVGGDDSGVVHVVRPNLGTLELDDGSRVDLTDELVIGRNPSADTDPERAGFRRVSVGGDKVSRVHVEVRLRGWDVLVGDCGSTNGTFVVPHAGSDVVQLEPGRLQIIDDGATVYFGSRSFVMHGRSAVG